MNAQPLGGQLVGKAVSSSDAGCEGGVVANRCVEIVRSRPAAWHAWSRGAGKGIGIGRDGDMAFHPRPPRIGRVRKPHRVEHMLRKIFKPLLRAALREVREIIVAFARLTER